MSRLETLARGRAAAEAGMTDECVVIAGVARGEWDETTNDYGPGVETYSYDGICKFKADGSQPSDLEVAGRPATSIEPELHLPVLSSQDVEVRQRVRITASVTDPTLVGREFTISGMPAGTYMTARRIRVTEMT